MKVTTVIGQTYALRSMSGGDLTNEAGDVLETLEPGVQLHVTAQEPAWVLPEDCQVTACRTFKNASLAIRLLGGGNKSGLPSGYLAAYFLESSGNAYIKTGVTEFGVATYDLQIPEGEALAAMGFNHTEGKFGRIDNVYRVTYTKTPVRVGRRDVVQFAVFRNEYALLTIDGVGYKGGHKIPETSIGEWCLWTEGYVSGICPARIWRFSLEVNGAVVCEYIPVIDKAGKPCMWDSKNKVPKYATKPDATYIVGFTLSQARKLGKLAPGSSFTVSLPGGWQEDAGVVEALAQAEANGCVLPVQEYSEGEAAAATYALRRIWVKRTPDALGTYVDSDGQRWLVEWCVDVIGAAPETLGYERYRSVEVAADYWGLTPYVEPETELETLTETE